MDRFARFRRTAALLGWLILAALAAARCSSAPPPSPEPAAPAVAPEALAGDWMLETRVGDQSREGKLHFSVTGAVLAGSVFDADGNSHEMENITLKDGKISWQAGSQKFEGTAGSIAMKGTVSRAARQGRQGREGGDEEGESGSGASSSGRGGGGGYGRGGHGGHGGGRGGGSSAPKVTWSAYKSVPSPTPGPTTTPAGSR